MVTDRFLDSNDLERERGITILSKNISIPYKNVKINLIDTPGHADFGGEVERVLKMVDGVLLLVDSFEGPMPQTRFVLEKALHLNLRPIVVINKMDRTDRRPAEVLDEIYDLFIELDVDESQLDFPVIYAGGRDGWASESPDEPGTDLSPLMEKIIECIPKPEFIPGPVRMQVTSLDYSSYVGRIGIGRVFRGILSKSDPLGIIRRDGRHSPVTLKQLFTFEGLHRVETTEVYAGDICAVVGIANVDIGDTIAHIDHLEPLPIIAIDEPTISMNFTINTSPFFGKEGKYVTSQHLKERLRKELEHNVALKVEETASPETFKVSGRGILHLSILIENMRREGYEFAVGAPKVIYKTLHGKKTEPIEILMIDAPAEYAGKIIEIVGKRRGEMIKMDHKINRVRIEFHIPSRGLTGLRNRILTATSGEASMHHRFYQYEYFKGSIIQRQSGALISMHEGPATAYALNALQDRGKFFVAPGDVTYRGQIVGEYNKENDIEVHVQRNKKLTNMRAANADKTVRLKPAVKFSLEEALEYIRDDELVEVTPRSIRMRKLYLDTLERKRFNRKKQTATEKIV